MFTKFQNKAVGFGMGTLVSIAQKKKKKMFSERISHTRTYRSYGMKCKYKGKHLLGISTFHLEIKLPPYSRYGTGKQGWEHTPNRGF